jgi:type III pantothenate kinase
MLLVIDIGNTNTVLGVYDGRRLIKDWRLRTERNTTEDEVNIIITSLFAQSGIRPDQIDRTIISSVVPPMVTILDSFCRKYLGYPPLWVNPASYTGMPIHYRNPSDVGTATTFDSISENGEYLGGAISPGIMIAAEALFMKASKLPRVEIYRAPASVIGKDTAASIQSGIVYGYAALVDGMVRRMRGEMGSAPRVIATGGLAELMRDVSETIEAVEPLLTLDGLRIIAAEMGQGG